MEREVAASDRRRPSTLAAVGGVPFAALNELEQFLVVGVNLHVVGLGTEVLVRAFRFGMSSSRTAVLVFDD